MRRSTSPAAATPRRRCRCAGSWGGRRSSTCHGRRGAIATTGSLGTDLLAHERRHGRIPRRAIVLLRTGFGAFWPDRERYLGTAELGAQAVPKLHFPGLHPNGARWLVRERDVRAVGLDTASIDYGQSTLFESHRVLAAAGVPIFENVANLQRVPTEGALVIALPMKIEGGSGGPLRMIAIVPRR